MVMFMSDANSPAGPIWLTYKQAAERLGLSSPNAAEAKAKRAKWPKRIRDDTGEVEIAAPPELLAASSQKPEKSRQAFPVVSPAPATPALADVVRAAGAPLEAVLERQELANKLLQTALDVARAEIATVDAERRIAEARAADMEKLLERSDLDRQTSQKQVETLRDQLAAAQAEAAQATGAANTERARRDVANAKIAALQLQLDEAVDARERRPWWKRGLFTVWLALSMLWIGRILAVSGQCVYGPWIGWQQPWCEYPLVNPVLTYLDVIAMAQFRTGTTEQAEHSPIWTVPLFRSGRSSATASAIAVSGQLVGAGQFRAADAFAIYRRPIHTAHHVHFTSDAGILPGASDQRLLGLDSVAL